MVLGELKKKHTEAYSYYISQSLGDEASDWIESNEKKMNIFINHVNQ
jgi:hypothetical protein